MRIKGWKNVLKFTYIQTIKAKSFIVSMSITVAIFTLMIALANFLPGILASGSDEDKKDSEFAEFAIEKIYIYDHTSLNIDFSVLPQIGIEFEHIEDEQTEALVYQITPGDKAEVLVMILPGSVEVHGEGVGYELKIFRPEDPSIMSNSDCQAVLAIFESQIHKANLISLGVREENVYRANTYVQTGIFVGLEKQQSEIAQVITGIMNMLISVILFVLIVMFGQLTAQAIATEKASRVMELLLTSVKPLAVVVGKVLGTMLVALTTVVILGGISTIAFFAVAPYGILGELTGIVEVSEPIITEISSEFSTVFAGFTPISILLILLIFILGFLFYALISALIGASVSKIEDLQTALQPLMLTGALGFYLAYIIPALEMDSSIDVSLFTKLSWYLPISSPFALPGAILSGRVQGTEMLVAIGVLVIFVVLFALFVSKVYEHIILHNGNRVKVKDMFKMLKT